MHFLFLFFFFHLSSCFPPTPCFSVNLNKRCWLQEAAQKGPLWVLIWNINIWSWESLSIRLWHHTSRLWSSCYYNLDPKLKGSRDLSLIVQVWSNNAASYVNEITQWNVRSESTSCPIFITCCNSNFLFLLPLPDRSSYLSQSENES